MKKTIARRAFITVLSLAFMACVLPGATADGNPKIITPLLPKPQEVRATTNNVLMTMQLQRHYKVGQPVVITVTIKNLRSIRIRCDNLPPYGNSIISLKRMSNGAVYDVPLTDFGQQYNPADPISKIEHLMRRSVAPGETFTTAINLDRLYKLTATGTYEVTIGQGINEISDDNFVIQTAPLQFQLDPSSKTEIAPRV